MRDRDQTNPITDHALLRYLQREKGVDIEAIRDEIATDFVRAACQARASSVVIGHTHFKICSAGKVRTVVNRAANKRRSTPGDVEKGKRHNKKRKRRRITNAERDAIIKSKGELQ